MKYYRNFFLLFLSSFCVLHSYSFKTLTVLSEGTPYRTGPFSVHQSLLSGLRLLQVPFNHNPSMANVGDVVMVVSGVENLRRAIEWKKHKRINCVLGGPNIMNRPHEFNYLFAQKEVDVCLVPSHWIQVAYEEDAPTLKGRIRCWPAGVDINFWKPSERSRDCVLVYWKTESEQLCLSVEALLRKYGYTPVRIRYKFYAPQTYKNTLNRAKFAVFISRSESQGIALAEAWSMNVPTLIWDPGELTYLGRVYSPVSAGPYLTKDTGLLWKNIIELEKVIAEIPSLSFCPRDWVLKNMSYEASTSALLSIIDQI